MSQPCVAHILEDPCEWIHRNSGALGWQIYGKSTQMASWLKEHDPSGGISHALNMRGKDSIRPATTEASALLLLENDWDDEGSLAVDGPTLERAKDFLVRHARFFTAFYGASLEPPEFAPTRDGSVDLYWETATYELLINVPTEREAPVSYYGDNTQGNNPIKGKCSLDRVDFRLLAWLFMIR